MSDSILPNKASVAVQAQSMVPMPSPKKVRAEKVEGPSNYPKDFQGPASWERQQAEGGERTEAEWNTKNILPRLATDAVSAGSAAVMVAPLITIIDK